MALEIVPVRSRRELRRFVDVPWTVNRDAPEAWVPPLRLLVEETLDERKNPFWQHAERELWTVERDGAAVGRIAAVENRAHNRYHGDRVGFFGFFECVDDPEAARALVAAASAWLRDRGLDRLRGPVSPSTNYEVGTLVDGFRHPASFLTPWNPPYYDRLLTGAGLDRAKDLLAFWFPLDDPDFQLPERLRTLTARIRAREGFDFRLFDRRRLGRESRLVQEMYEAAWADNWGFVPPSDAEFDEFVKLFRLLVIEEASFVAEVDGEAVGFVIVVRDLNRVLRKVRSGRLLPFGWLRVARALLGRFPVGRVMLLGVAPGSRSKAIFPVFLEELVDRGRAYGGTGGEASWILEDNGPIVGAFRSIGLEPTKRWRIYEAPLDRE